MNDHPGMRKGRVLDLAPPQAWSVDPSLRVWGAGTVFTLAPFQEGVVSRAYVSMFDVSLSMSRLLLRADGVNQCGYNPLPLKRISVDGPSNALPEASVYPTVDNHYEVDISERVFDVTADVAFILRTRRRAVLTGWPEYTHPAASWFADQLNAPLVLPPAAEYPTLNAHVRQRLTRTSEDEPEIIQLDAKPVTIAPAWDPRGFSIDVLHAEPSVVIRQGNEDHVVVEVANGAQLSAPHIFGREDGTCVIQLQLYGPGEVVLVVPPDAEILGLEREQSQDSPHLRLL